MSRITQTTYEKALEISLEINDFNSEANYEKFVHDAGNPHSTIYEMVMYIVNGKVNLYADDVKNELETMRLTDVPEQLKPLKDKLIGRGEKLLRHMHFFEMQYVQNEENEVHNNANYTILEKMQMDRDTGFVFAHNQEAPSAFVTWQYKIEDGQKDYFWGHYFGDRDEAQKDFSNRVNHYGSSMPQVIHYLNSQLKTELIEDFSGHSISEL